MRRLGVVVFALLLVPLAGCAGENEPPSNEGPDDSAPGGEGPGAQADDRFSAPPAWEIGQYWTYQTTFGSENRLVVTADEGDAWRIDTTNEQTAFWDARNDVSTMGPQRKADLAGSQNGTWVQFFQWPMEEGATWTTRWDGVERTIEVVSIDGDIAELEAREGDVVRVTYSYDAVVGWFGRFTFHNDDGSVSFGSQLAGSGVGHNGDVVRYTLDKVAHESGMLGPGPVLWGHGFEVPEGATDIYLHLDLVCTNGAWTFGVNAQGANEGNGFTEACPMEMHHQDVFIEAPSAGAWQVGMSAAADGEGHYVVQVWVRTLERVPIEYAPAPPGAR